MRDFKEQSKDKVDKEQLTDNWGRRISYLRLSVTDRCDFRCEYCMPARPDFLPKREVLSLEELELVANAFAQMGVSKIRVTGGEPLVRPKVIELLRNLRANSLIKTLAITTNGSQLSKLANELAQVPIDSINISLDTLDAEVFNKVTRGADLAKVLSGIEHARKLMPGRIKLNVVLIKGVNDTHLPELLEFACERSLDISLIEQMPLGDVGYQRQDQYFGCDEAVAELAKHFSFSGSNYNSGGPARYLNIKGSVSKLGLISPHSHNFCDSCNRVRVTCTGQLYPCLGQDVSVDLRAALRSTDDPKESIALVQAGIKQSMAVKPLGHTFDLTEKNVQVVRFMSSTGG